VIGCFCCVVIVAACATNAVKIKPRKRGRLRRILTAWLGSSAKHNNRNKQNKLSNPTAAAGTLLYLLLFAP